MDRTVILEKVKNIISDVIGVEPTEISNETTLVGELEMESIDFMDLSFRLEREFSIRLSSTELFEVSPETAAVSTIVEFVWRKLNETNQANSTM